MYQNLHFYIDLKWEDYILDEKDFFTRIIKLVEIAYQHELTVFYSKRQLEEFVENCGDWDTGFSSSKNNQLDILLGNAIAVRNEFFMFEVLFANENTSLNPINNPSIRAINNNEKILLVSFSENFGRKSFLCVTDNNLFEKIEVSFCNTIQNILDWIQKNSEARNFHLSPKHGENGIGNWPGESPLMCDKDKAQDLLNKAIADFRENRRLFYLDNDCFIEFFYEGNNPQKQWHGFHIKKEDWEKRVPIKVRRFFLA